MTEQSSIPVEAQAVPDQPVAWAVFAMFNGEWIAQHPICFSEDKAREHSLAETLGEAANLLSPRGKWFISESLACQRAEGCTSPADCSSTDTCKD